MEFCRILALCLNPALDVTLWTEDFWREYNPVTAEQCEAAGKAVNVARVLHAYGKTCQTLVVLGESNKERYVSRLAQDGIPFEAVCAKGKIRENLSLVSAGGQFIRLAREGFVMTREILEEIKGRLPALVTPGTLVVFAGKHPKGFSPEDFVQLGLLLQQLGGKLAVDTSSVSIREMRAVSPWIIKPNLEELEQMCGQSLPTLEQQLQKLSQLRKEGISRILLSKGEQGLLYSGPEGVWEARVPTVPVKSTVGAGDSSLSGFLLAYLEGKAPEDLVRTAAAFGTGAVMVDGTNPPRQEDLLIITPKIKVTRLE